MNKIKNIFTKALLFCFCLSLNISWYSAPALAAGGAKLGFSPTSGTYYVGDEFNVQVTIDTDGQPADAVDGFFNYDASEMQITQFTTGPAFQAYPGQQYNNPPGQVKITGFSVLNPLNGTSHIATIKLKALKATNDAQINYEFTLQDPPITTDSNIAKSVTSEDILKQAQNASFKFVPDNNPPYTVNHNPAPNATNVPQNTNISFNIKDDERGVNIDTVSVTIKGITYTKNSAQFSYSGSKKNYHIVINPTSNFNFAETVNVGINGSDIDGNAMSKYNYSFKIGDAPPTPNIPPKIVKITPLSDPTKKLLKVEADDPDAPNTDLTLTVNGVPISTPFTDNGDGTGLLDYTDLAPGNYYVTFTATDKGTPPLTDTDGTWIMVGTPTTPPPPAPQVNHPPKFKPVEPIEIELDPQEEASTSSQEAIINIEAIDPDNDPLTLFVQAPEMNNFTFIDLGNGTGTLHWTPQQPGLYTAVFTATDDGTPSLSDSLIVTVFVTGQTVCPTFEEAVTAEETVYVCPSDDEKVADIISEKMDPTLITTREEAVKFILKNLNLETQKKTKFQQCAQNYNSCLSIFRLNSKYQDTKITKTEITSLYPDYNDLEGQSRQSINLATIDGFVTGYYGDYQSPFKPNRAVSRIEALTMMLRASDLIPTLYREELVAILGGESALKSQISPFKDIDPKKEAHWWYVVPANAALKFGIIDQTSNFRPDEFITEEEFLNMFNRLKTFIDTNQHFESLKADTDVDGITDQNETKIFNTDPNNPDTDLDKLTDYEELIIHKTNPNLADTDNDGLDDSTEIDITQTNPLNPDTDGDGFPDGFEVNQSKTDPKNSASFPEDLNQNGISDEWEKDNKIFIADITEAARDIDTDGDGLSNNLEFINKSNPQKADTDDDGRSDGEEVLLYKTDPTVANAKDDIKLRFTNIQDGQTVSNRKLVLQGIAPENKTVSVVIRNEFHEKILGTTTADENNIFLFEIPIELQDGEYYLLYKVLDDKNKTISPSTPTRIIVNSQLAIAPPVPTKLDQETITKDVLLQNLRISVENNKPILVGNTEIGNQVIAIWKSVVFTSALIADSTTGEFEIQAPNELQPGEHTVYVYAVRPEDQSISETIRIPFKIEPKPSENRPPTKTAIPEEEKTLTEQGQALFSQATETATQNLTIIIAIISVGLLAFFGWRIFFRRDDSDSDQPTNPPKN